MPSLSTSPSLIPCPPLHTSQPSTHHSYHSHHLTISTFPFSTPNHHITTQQSHFIIFLPFPVNNIFPSHPIPSRLSSININSYPTSRVNYFSFLYPITFILIYSILLYYFSSFFVFVIIAKSNSFFQCQVVTFIFILVFIAARCHSNTQTSSCRGGCCFASAQITIRKYTNASCPNPHCYTITIIHNNSSVSTPVSVPTVSQTYLDLDLIVIIFHIHPRILLIFILARNYGLRYARRRRLHR